MIYMEHELKIWPAYFAAVLDGRKTFEVRKNDRGFNAGDTVYMREFDPAVSVEIHRYTGMSIRFRIGYVLPIDAERVVFSLLPLLEGK